MKKFARKILTALIAGSILLTAAACGDDSGPKPGPSDGLSGEIEFLVPLANVDLAAMNSIANAYMDIHPNVKVNIVENNGSGYLELVRSRASNPSKDMISIVRVSQINEYYGTDKIVDFRDYLEEENEYAAGAASYDGTWKSVLELDAYPTEGKANTIPALSYESNYTVCFYDKRAMKDLVGDENYAPQSWEDLLNLLDKAKQDGYLSPLGLDFSDSSCAGIFMGWFVKMYADQYFRDFVSEAHSQEGDYSRVAFDSSWEYDAADHDLDRADRYTSNLNRVIDTFFNNSDFKLTSPRFEDMMINLKKLYGYTSEMNNERATILGLDETANYWNNQTGVNSTASGSDQSRKNVFLRPARLDSVLDYITRYALDKTENNKGDVSSIISSRFGWFNLPAMTANSAAGKPAADNLRSLGGPVNELGIIHNGSQQQVELAVDFLKYLFSPKGQNSRFDTYLGNGYTVVMPSLVKDCVMSAKIDQVTGHTYTSGCDRNPINVFTLGYGDGNITAAGQGTTTLNNAIGKLYGQYFRGSGSWSEPGRSAQKLIEDSFPLWAEYRNLKYKDFATDTINKATNNMTENPVERQQ